MGKTPSVSERSGQPRTFSSNDLPTPLQGFRALPQAKTISYDFLRDPEFFGESALSQLSPFNLSSMFSKSSVESISIILPTSDVFLMSSFAPAYSTRISPFAVEGR